MNYLVSDSKKGKVFGNLEEASRYANTYFRKTRIIVSVTPTTRKVSHSYKKN